ncbi:EamA family transporter [Citreimonas sp.]|uniref:EamA family transporter n=1 Tax=Citreimonas sp. TaxID=3036715 RepID=UPI0035C7A64C
MSPETFGQILAVCSAVSFALANVFISRTTRSGGDKGVMFSVLVTMAFSGALWLLLEAGGGGLSDAPDFWRGFGWFVFAGVSAMVFGRSLVFESLRRLGVTRATAVKRLNPFFSVALAAVFLSEAITPRGAAGMAAIAIAFAVLIHQSFRDRGKLNVQSPAPSSYLFGLGGAMAYAVAYVARAAGLDHMPAPAFGTFVSAVSGFVVFAGIAVVSTRYRGYFANIFSSLDRWIVLGAIMVSGGQILLFAALAYESVSTVVMIASVEIFFSIILSVLVFRSESAPRWPVLAAAALAMVGVVLVATG